MIKTLEKVELQKAPGKAKPVYKQIVEQLRRNIQERRIAPGEHLPPIPQLVTAWGVGYSTVHAALRALEKDGLLTCKTQWGKGPVVLGPTNQTELRHVMFVRWINSRQFLDIEDGIRNYFSWHTQNDFIFNTVDCNRGPVGGELGDRRHIAALRHAVDSVDGLIVYPWEFEEFQHLIEDILKNGKHVVFVDRNIHGVEASSVSCDHFRGAYMATQHLIETHHCPAYYFGDMPAPSSCVDRLNGYVEAMRENGYSPLCDSHIYKMARGETGYSPNDDRSTSDAPELDAEATAFLKQSLKTNEKVCVFCMNDHLALALYNAAVKLGATVGRDVFIVGFGDKPYCSNLPAPLTSVAQFDTETGFKAAHLLHKCLLGKHSEFIHVVLPVELKIRKSSTG